MILLIFFAMNNAGVVPVIYFNVVLIGKHKFLSAVYLLLSKKNAKLFMLPFLHKNDKIQISQFSVKNKQIFKIIVFHALTKIKSSCALF